MKARLALLHGFTGSPSSWDAVVAQLHADIEVLTPALWGHDPEVDTDPRDEDLRDWDLDASEHPRIPDITPHAFSEESARLIGWIGGHTDGPVHLAGYSLGARHVLDMVTMAPELFASATLIGVNPGLRTEEERAARRSDDQRWIQLLDGGIEPFVNEWERLPLWRTQARLPAEMREAQRADRLRRDPKGLQRSLRIAGLAEMPDLRPRLPRATMPVTLMVGAQDPKFLALAGETAALLPHARLVVVPDAGHNLLLERPEAVAHELNRNVR